MHQSNHQFSFPLTYYGSLNDLDGCEEEDTDESFAPWTLLFEPEIGSSVRQNTGLFILWHDSL